MKKCVMSLIVFLWGLALPVLADTLRIYNIVTVSNGGHITFNPTELYVPSTLTGDTLKSYILDSVAITPRYVGYYKYSHCQADGIQVKCNLTTTGVVETMGITYYQSGPYSTVPESNTCAQLEGSFVTGEYASDTPFCATTPILKGGSTPNEPLLCETKWAGETGGGNNQFQFSNLPCAADTSPDPVDPNPDPDPDPAPDPDPDPDPDPEPDPDPTDPVTPGQPGTGTDGGNTPPTSGTTGNQTGNIGDQTVNITNDYTPITERLDLMRDDMKKHSNYVSQRIDNQTNVNAQGFNYLGTKLDGVKSSVDGLGTKVDAVKTAVDGLGTKIDGVTDAVNNQTTELGEKLDGVKDGITDLKDWMQSGEPIDGEQKAGEVTLPDYDTWVQGAIGEVSQKVEEHSTNSGLENLTNANNVRGLFSSAESISQIFDIAQQSCSPIDFGSYGKLNFCAAAPRISQVLEFIIWALTAIFIFTYVSSILTKERLS